MDGILTSADALVDLQKGFQTSIATLHRFVLWEDDTIPRESVEGALALRQAEWKQKERALEDNVKAKEMEIAVLRKKIEIKDRLIQKRTGTIKKLQREDKAPALEKEIDRWRQAWEHLGIKFDRADRLAGEERRQTESWRLQAADSEARIATAWESDRRCFSAEADELRKNMSDVSEELAELHSKYDALQKLLTADQQAFYAEAELLKNNLATTTTSLDERTKELQRMTRKFEDTTQQLQKSEEQNAELTEAIRQDRELIATISDELSKTHEDLRAADQQVVARRAEIALLKEGQRFATEDVCSQQRERNEARACYLMELMSKTGQIKHLQKISEEERNQFSARVKSLQDEKFTLRAESEAAIQSLKQQLSDLWRRFDTIDLTAPPTGPFMKTTPPLASDLDTNVLCGNCRRHAVMTNTKCFLSKPNTFIRPRTEHKMRARSTWR